MWAVITSSSSDIISNTLHHAEYLGSENILGQPKYEPPMAVQQGRMFGSILCSGVACRSGAGEGVIVTWCGAAKRKKSLGGTAQQGGCAAYALHAHFVLHRKAG